MQKTTENMTINELMHYYLEKTEVANGGSTTAKPGHSGTIFVETKGGEGYTEQIEARIWGEINSEPTVLLKLFHERYYAVSHETYKEICDLLSRDLSQNEITTAHTSQGAYPGGIIDINLPGKPTMKAKAWYEIAPGEITLFSVDDTLYAISRKATKTVSVRTISQRKTGSFATPNPKREIIWHKFDLSGNSIPDFPNKPSYLS